jgi:hypothetical protein
LNNDEIEVARQKRLQVLKQQIFVRDFIKYSIFLVVLFLVGYYDHTVYSNQYKTHLDKIFSVDKFQSVNFYPLSIYACKFI